MNGVGYVVTCSTRTLQKLPRAGEAAALSIETQVREDSIRLFGFESDAERDSFKLLQSPAGRRRQGGAGDIVDFATGELASAIAMQDKALVSRAPGVGPKLAGRIVAELKDKAPAFGAVDPVLARLAGEDEARGAPSSVRDAISALCNLGPGRPQAAVAVAASVNALGEDADAGALIRRGLKELAG